MFYLFILYSTDTVYGEIRNLNHIIESTDIDEYDIFNNANDRWRSLDIDDLLDDSSDPEVDQIFISESASKALSRTPIF